MGAPLLKLRLANQHRGAPLLYLTMYILRRGTPSHNTDHKIRKGAHTAFILYLLCDERPLFAFYFMQFAKGYPFAVLQYAFRDRKNKKRSFRALWIARINAGARELGVSYSILINSLIKKDITLDRKILSDIAITDSATFEKIVKTATSQSYMFNVSK